MFLFTTLSNLSFGRPRFIPSVAGNTAVVLIIWASFYVRDLVISVFFQREYQPWMVSQHELESQRL